MNSVPERRVASVHLGQGRSVASGARRHRSHPVVRPDHRMSPRNSAAPGISDSERSPPLSGNHGPLALQPTAHACQHSAKLRLPALGLEPARFQSACGAATDRSSLEVPTYISRSPISVSLATTGAENRVGTIGSASATPGRANLRRMVAFVFVRPAHCRHGLARSHHALTPTAFGLMTARPSRHRRSSSECQRERDLGSAIVFAMGVLEQPPRKSTITDNR